MKKQLKNLQNFYKATDHKLINRFICAVCGRFDLTADPIENFEKSTNLIVQNKEILNSHHLVNFTKHEYFVYPEFPELNGCVLDRDGFNISNYTV